MNINITAGYHLLLVEENFDFLYVLFAALHQCLEDKLSQGLIDHSPRSCIVCNPDAGTAGSDHEHLEEFQNDKVNILSL